MDFLQKQNTEALQARFPEVYQRFFAENDLVISVPFFYALTFGISDRIGALRVRQKFPWRAFVGITPCRDSGVINVGSSRAYSTKDAKFMDLDYEILNWERTLPYLAKYIKEKFAHDVPHGITLNFLLERSESTGIHTEVSPAIMAGLCGWFSFYESEELQKLGSLPSREIWEQKTSLSQMWRELRDISAKIKLISFEGALSAGGAVYEVLVDSKTPTVFFTEERGGTIKNPYGEFPPLDFGKDIERYAAFHWCAARLDELVSISGIFPVDVVGISVGGGIEPRSPTSHLVNVMIPYFDDLRDEIVSIFSKINMPPEHLPMFLRHPDRNGYYLQQFIRGQTCANLLLLQVLVHLYKNKLSSSSMGHFLDVISTSTRNNAPFQEPFSDKVGYIIEEIRRRGMKNGVKIGARALGNKSDASFLIFLPPRQFRESIFTIVEELKNAYDPNVSIDFASWRDGWGKDGLRVEQFISKGIYSKFIEPDAVRLVQWTRKGEVRTSIGKHDSTKGAGRDILIDMVHEKIQVAGKECTSKELPSQKATVAIIDALLSAEGHRLHNRALPESGYTKYRNEFQGKITGPLVALVKKRLKKELPLKIEGTLTDFWVSLDPKGFEIGVVKKMG